MFTTHVNILADCGSKYAVSGGPATNKADALSLLKPLKREKKFTCHPQHLGARHPDGPLKNDGGGAGLVIVRMLEWAELQNHLIITRRFGGTHLGGDRFRRVQECVSFYLDQMDRG